jgi:hypothetical protein
MKLSKIVCLLFFMHRFWLEQPRAKRAHAYAEGSG